MKKLVSMAMAGIMAAGMLFTGCSGSGGTESQSTGNVSGDGIDYNMTREVRVVGHLFDDARREIFERVCEMMKEKWPNVTIVDDNMSDHATKLKLELSSGAGPEIFSVDDLYQQQLLAYISDITDLVQERGWAERSLEGALDFNNQRTPGKYYSVPFSMSPCAFYYNKDIFAELGLEIPTTPEELDAVCETILEKSDYIPFANAGLSNRQALWMLYCDLTERADMDEVRSWYFQTETTENVKKAFIESYGKLQEWSQRGYFGDIKTMLGVDHLVYISNVYAKGNVAMAYDGDWRLADFEASGINTGVFPYPSEYGTNAVDFSWALNKEFENDPTMRAFFADFVDCFFEQEIVAAFYEAGFTPSIKFDNTGLVVSPLREEFMSAVSGQKVGYFLDNAAPGMFEALTQITQKLMLGEVSPEEAWEETEAAYEQGKAAA